MAVVNGRLITHPMNWLIILLMLVIAGIFGHFVLSYLGIEPSTANKKQVLAGYQAQ